MKKLLLASVAASAITAAQSANAADMAAPMLKAPPAAPVFSWTGCSVGVQAGWGFQRNKLSQSQFNTFSTAGTLEILSSSSRGNVDTAGAVLGAQVGCDYQFANNLVIGLQGMAMGSDIGGTEGDPHNGTRQTSNVPAGAGNIHTFGGGSVSVRTKDIESVTARLGWTGWSPQTLFYVKGGGARVDSQVNMTNSSIFFNTFPGSPIFDKTYYGWTAGGGVETMIAGNWSGFLEVNFYDFANKTLFAAGGTPHVGPGVNVSGATLASNVTITTVTAGINYRFH